MQPPRGVASDRHTSHTCIQKRATSCADHQMASARAAAVTPDVRERLETLYETCQLLLKQMRGGGSGSHELATTLTEFFNQLTSSSKAVADSCTKLSVLFSRPPCPSQEECGALCARVEQTVMALVSVSYHLSPAFGVSLLKEVQGAVGAIVQGVELLARSIAKEGCMSECRPRLRGTGSVWESCENIVNVSRDNRAAVLKVVISQLHLLRDACSEVDKLVESNGGSGDTLGELEEITAQLSLEEVPRSTRGGGEAGSDIMPAAASKQQVTENTEEDEEEEEMMEGWTAEDRPLVDSCVQLVKSAASITDRVCRVVVSHGTSTTAEQVGELDEAAHIIQQLSPLVDDLVCELEPPLDQKQLSHQGAQLQQTLVASLQRLSTLHFCKLAGEQWDTESHSELVQQQL